MNEEEWQTGIVGVHMCYIIKMHTPFWSEELEGRDLNGSMKEGT
jgi:hypothetical protein